MLFNLEAEDDMFLQNTSWLLPDYTRLYPRKYNST
jgi:hypothetical protein